MAIASQADFHAATRTPAVFVVPGTSPDSNARATAIARRPAALDVMTGLSGRITKEATNRTDAEQANGSNPPLPTTNKDVIDIKRSITRCWAER